MDAHHTAGRLRVGLASLALLAGCASGASPTPLPSSPTPTSALSAAVATPTPTPTPIAIPAAVSYGPVTVVAGTSDCGDLNPTWTTDQDGTSHARNQTFECTDTTNDPRVSGAHIATWSMDVWGDFSTVTLAGVQWGTVRIENAGGTWEGTFSGVASLPGPGDTIAEWYRGTGDYEGLAYFELVTGVCCVYKIQGQILPGGPPTP